MKCVYKIKCRDPTITEFYIGSSINFDNRKVCHKTHSTNLNCKEFCYPLYMFMNVNGGIDNWEFEIIKEYKFLTEEELTMNEQYYIDLLEPELNSRNAKGLDPEQRKKNNNIHNKLKGNCPQCGKEMRKKNIKQHLKVCRGV